MLTAVLSVVVLLVIGGCFCVYWTARGDAPRWARGVAMTTEVMGELVRQANKKSRTNNNSGGGSDD